MTTAIHTDDLHVYFDKNHALNGVSMDIEMNQVTAIIGPSGCGKSTFLRCINRMNDLIPGCTVKGKVMVDGEDVNDDDVDVVDVRRRIGMVFQKPNPFPKSIYENVAYGPRLHGIAETVDGKVRRRKHTKKELDGIVEHSCRRAALWDEVKDRLEKSGTSL